MTKVVEIYADKADPEIVAKESRHVSRQEEEIREQVEYAEQLGLTTLANQDKQSVQNEKAIAWCKARGLEPISEDERKTWVEWLPTGYYSTKKNQSAWEIAPTEEDGGKSELKGYSYHEGIPTHARKLMVDAMPHFTTLEIRTPERQPVLADPALFGHIVHPNGERDIVLLSRWAESDANFVSLEDIKIILKARHGLFSLWGDEVSGIDRVERFVFGFFFFGAILGFVGLLVFGRMSAVGWIHAGVAGALIVTCALAPTLSYVAERSIQWFSKRRLCLVRPELAHLV